MIFWRAPTRRSWGEVALSYLPWAPTVDDETIPTPPLDRVRAGAAADIDLLVGSNREETRLFLLSDGSIDRITEEALAGMAAAYGLPAESLSAYRAAHPGASAGDLFSMIQTDWYWRVPAVRLADAHASNARAATYMYEFAWRSPQMGGRLGAAHSVEIAFVFDTLGLGTEPMLGRDHLNRWRTPCIGPGWPSQRAATAAGPSTIPPAGRRFASIQRLKS